MNTSFSYDLAFSRNIGWVTETEQAILRAKRIAIAGLGGVGGSHLLTLTRLGIGRFNISDLDTFEQANFNRQAGASMRHVGRAKVEVLEELAKDINPELELRAFPDGVNAENIEDFLDGVDLYVDGLDFFAVKARRAVFAACARKGIPAITAAPLGMGTAVLNFLPGKMTFEEYFRLEGHSEDEQLLRFLLGLSPSMLQMSYLVDDSRVDLANHKGPSTPMSCELCAGMAGTHALKILLQRGGVPAAPWGLHFDAFKNRFKRTWRPGGNDNPLQKLGLAIARVKLAGQIGKQTVENEVSSLDTPLDRILDLARWAPSGDNTQPWRFEIIDEAHFTIHAHDTRDWCVYDLEGRASQLAVGALLETIAIAASGEGLEAEFITREDAPETNALIDVHLSKVPETEPHPLHPFIRARVTQRRPMSTRPLTGVQKQALQESVGPGYRVIWIEGWARKWQMAKLLFKSAKIRLTIPEAYAVHKRIIEWDAQYSEDRIPDQAVGLDPVALKLMKWAMHSWDRVRNLNRYLAGTWMPRIQLDLLPALRCGAHFVILSEQELESLDDYFDGGRAFQRFWLTATSLGLQFQPEMTPLIFTHYSDNTVAFSGEVEAIAAARSVEEELKLVLDQPDVSAKGVYMGRVGSGAAPAARSVRLPRDKLAAASIEK